MKKIAAICMVWLMLCSAASAYYFPEPDWGALLKEKKSMVSQTDFELYMEGPVSASPYYGVKLEPRGGAYFGMVAETADFLDPLGAYLTYISMDDRETDIYYPANEIIRRDNCVVTVGYNVSSLGKVDYDTIRRTLENLASYGKPMLIRFANEMNVSSLGDEPEEYIRMFRTVADMVHEYENFAVVWSPNDMGALDRPFSCYYPGDAYVDWVGVSSYMKMYFQGNTATKDKDATYFMTGDYAWATNALKPIITFMEQNGIEKPVMLSECGVTTENIHKAASEAWAAPRLRNLYYNVLMKYPQVKLINYFNVYRPEKETYYVHDESGRYKDRTTDKPYAMEIMKEAVSSGAYISEAGGEPAFVFVPANSGYTAASADGIIDLYTLAHVPKVPQLSVHYYVDGVWFGERREAPYKISLDLAGFADGEHTVRIVSNGMEKAYTFIKRGNGICFGGEPDGAVLQAAGGAPASNTIRVLVNGNQVSFDVPPQIIGDRTMVPVRAIFEALGATVEWIPETKTVKAVRGGTTVTLQIDSASMTVNGQSVTLDVPAQIVGDRTLVPVRAVSEGFGCRVTWDGAGKTVIVEE